MIYFNPTNQKKLKINKIEKFEWIRLKMITSFTIHKCMKNKLMIFIPFNKTISIVYIAVK